ncbi:MAG: hypothetical protein IGS03_14920 [Candidatus Sericytochromatia bacterium]|nr:hypothetical protein [Candidatus Sericytochromatia bacterium]
MLQAEQYIDQAALAGWIQSWDEQRYMDYYTQQIPDRLKRLKVRSSMEETIVKIKKLCADMGEEINFHTILQFLNRIIFNCYFKIGSSALQIANYYEEILVPADQATRNRMLGYRQGRRETGDLTLYFEGKKVGQVGEQSDLFRLIFDACFLTEDELFDGDDSLLDNEQLPPVIVHSADEALMTLKIWQPVGMAKDDFVDLFLYHSATQLGLNFKRASFEAPLDRQQEPVQTDLTIHPVRTESLPLLYFNAASHNLPPPIVFMSYYHAIAYYFERATNLIIRDKMASMFDHSDLDQPPQLRRMAKAINTLKDNLSEKEALKLVLKKIVSLEHMVRWLEAKPQRKRWFTSSQEQYRELPLLMLTSEKDLVRSLLERIYAIKATISEERDKQEQFIWLHSLDDALLEKDVLLMKHLAARALEVWSVAEQA